MIYLATGRKETRREKLSRLFALRNLLTRKQCAIPVKFIESPAKAVPVLLLGRLNHLPPVVSHISLINDEIDDIITGERA